MLEEIERRIKLRLDRVAEGLASGAAVSFEAYKQGAGEIAGYRYALDIIREVMREHENS